MGRTSEIKPIETIYKGYRFRSRLEARWAVFFNAAGIEWQYEPEGYDIGCGEWYLPDFYLPEFDLYVEIKPFDRKKMKYIGDWNEAEATCAAFRDNVQKAILLCYGTPSEDLFKRLYAFDFCDSGAGSSDWNANFIYKDDQIYVVADSFRIDRCICVEGLFERNEHVRGVSEFDGDSCAIWEGANEIYEPYSKANPLQYAKTVSRAARFEYGENG